MTTFGDMVHQFGGMPVGVGAGLPFSSRANYFFVEPRYGSDYNTGRSPAEALATVTAAFALCTADQNDTIFVIANDMTAANTTTYLSAALDWNKDLTHLIGICTPSAQSQRARIAQKSDATGLSPLITISASGCMFKNLQFYQGVDDATSKICVKVTGGRNYFENVHFAGGGHETMAIDTACSLMLDGAEENVFNGCTFGVDTIGAKAGYAQIVFDTGAKRNIIRNSLVVIEGAVNTAAFLEVLDATAITHWNMFENTKFINSSSTVTLAQGALIAAVTTGGVILMDGRCMAHKITKWDNNDRGVLLGAATAFTAADLALVAVAMHVT